MRILQILSPDDDTHVLYGFETSNMTKTSFASGIKYLLLVFLGIVFVGGFSILGIGIWTQESEYGSRQLSSLIGVMLYQVDSYMLVISGGAVIIIALIGLCGVLAQYKCLMGLHLGLMAFLSIMIFVAGVLGYVLIDELEGKVRETMETTVTENYGAELDISEKNREITQAWDRIQQNFQCCGAYGDGNSTTSWALYKLKSKWFQLEKSRLNVSYVPLSCCGEENQELCTGVVGISGQPPQHGPPIFGDGSQVNYTLYTTGCFDKLESYLKRTGIVIGTAAITVGIFMLVELFLSVCMYRMLR